MNTEHIHLRVDLLHESPFNHRTHFDATDLQGLADDLKAVGMLQPLLVRPRIPELFAGTDDPNAVAGYELVFGHRRLRAAQLAQLDTVPCQVRKMTDAEVKRAQLSENLQRADVHPIEEAQAFQDLITEHGETADTLAASAGKSRSYVYGRLKLLDLCPKVRESCLCGQVSADVALLIARLRSNKLQEKALTAIEGKYLQMEDGGKKSFRQIRDLLNERFTLDLKTAPFPVTEAELLPAAGACTTCPKRSCNAPEYTDILTEPRPAYGGMNTGANVCTDPDCFALKKAAFFKREADALRAKGATVVDGNKARNAIDAHGQVKGDYIAIKDLKTMGVNVKNLATPGTKDDAPGVVTVTLQDPRSGKTVPAMRKADLVAAGVDLATATKQAARPSYHEEQARRAERAEAESQRRVAMFEQIRNAARLRERGAEEFRLVVVFMLTLLEDMARSKLFQMLRKHWGMAEDPRAGWADLVDQMSAPDLALLALDCLMVRDLEPDFFYTESEPEVLNQLATLYGLADPEPEAATEQPGEQSAPADAKPLDTPNGGEGETS